MNEDFKSPPETQNTVFGLRFGNERGRIKIRILFRLNLIITKIKMFFQCINSVSFFI